MGMYDNPPYYLSAYGLAVKHGFRGTESEWLVSLSAYGLACAEGFKGNLKEWLASIKGEPGTTCYEAAAAGGYEGSEEEFNVLLAAMADYIEGGSAAVEDGSITTSKLANSAVTEAKLSSGAVTAEKIATGAVAHEKLADGSVRSGKIENGAVTRDKIADGEVTNRKLATGAVTADKLEGNAVTGEKIALNAVTVLHTVEIGTQWSETSGLYTQELSVNGLLATSRVIADLIPANSAATAEQQLEDWEKILRITIGAGTATVIAKEQTGTVLTVQLLEVKK